MVAGGKGHQTAASFVAAWRHVHDVFPRAGTRNVIWLWNPNVVSGPAVDSFHAWWPGSRYVTWAGVDGYLWHPADTFTSVFAAALRQLRELAPGKPSVIPETGAYPGPLMGQRVTDLFAGAASAGVLAVIYFDHAGHSDWRIENNPSF